MTSQIIVQQIDIMVMGPKKYQFLGIILQKSFQYPQQTSSTQSAHSSGSPYAKLLKRFLNLSTQEKQNTSSNSQSIKSTQQLPSSSKELSEKDCENVSSLNEEAASVPLKVDGYCGVSKFTKMIETETFWVTLNFYVTDLKIYDPVLSEWVRGNVQIGILVGDDETLSMDQLKAYFSQSSTSTVQLLRESQKSSRTESSIESKIHSRLHSPYVNGFSSLLCLKLRDEYRLVEESNNLRLNNNQIFRWIVDRYFENKYRIKLKECLGDEIERGEGEKQGQNGKVGCEIM